MRINSLLTFLVAMASTVCFASDDNRIWKSERSDYRDEVTGTEVWRLTTNPEVEIIPDRIKDPWSPDGSQILFRSKRTGAWHLFVMTADGSKITRVTDRKGPAVYGVWSRSRSIWNGVASTNTPYTLSRKLPSPARRTFTEHAGICFTDFPSLLCFVTPKQPSRLSPFLTLEEGLRTGKPDEEAQAIHPLPLPLRRLVPLRPSPFSTPKASTKV